MKSSALVIFLLAFILAFGCKERDNKNIENSVVDTESDEISMLYKNGMDKLSTFQKLLKDTKFKEALDFYYENQGDIIIALENSEKVISFHQSIIIPLIHRLYESKEAYQRHVSILCMNKLYLESILEMDDKSANVINNYINTLYNLAFAYQQSDDIQKAIETSTSLIGVLESIENKDSLGYANVLHNTAIYYQEAKSYKKALSLFRKANKIYKDLDMVDSEEWENSVKRIKEVQNKI